MEVKKLEEVGTEDIAAKIEGKWYFFGNALKAGELYQDLRCIAGLDPDEEFARLIKESGIGPYETLNEIKQYHS